MLKIIIPETEQFNETDSTFFNTEETELLLEHSLISISKWESKWKKPFNDNKEKTDEEWRDYIRCMTINKNIDPNIYNIIPSSAIKEINRYINDEMTATWFSDQNNNVQTNSSYVAREKVTAELVYYWMVSLGIPFECQKWHFNKLITLIRVCS